MANIEPKVGDYVVIAMADNTGCVSRVTSVGPGSFPNYILIKLNMSGFGPGQVIVQENDRFATDSEILAAKLFGL